MSPGFADSPPWRPTVVILGVHHVVGRLARGGEDDLKLILAFGTVSQLGLITVMVGAGGGDLMLAGLAMLCAQQCSRRRCHGRRRHRPCHRHPRYPQIRLARAAQPTAVDHRGRRDGEHGRAAPVPRLVAKEDDLETVAHAPSPGAAAPYVLAGIVLGSVFTTVYSLRFLLGARPQGITETEQARRGDAPAACHLPRRACHPGRRGLGVRRVARRPG